MVLAVVDDLLFRSKISAAAKAAGIEIKYARSPETAVAAAAGAALILLDLDADRLRPLETLAALQADAALAGIPTVGFVSHVRADRIEAARSAGITRVMARSAFVVALPELVRGSAPPEA